MEREETPDLASAANPSGPAESAGERCSNGDSEGTGQEIVNSSGIPLKPFYTSADAPDRDGETPGRYPFTRGLFSTGYRTRLWTMRQYAGFGTAEQTNERFRYLLDQGQTGLSVAFDLPTQMGYDSDHPVAEGETGKVGVAIDSLKDMEILFDRIPLDRVTTSMTINAPAAILLMMVAAVAEKQGVPLEKLSGTVQNDILKEYVARGTYIFPPRPSVRLAADLMAYCAAHIPRWNAISVSGYHIRDAGATAVQEMAFSLANALAYVDAVLERGLAIDEFAPRISWIFNTHNDFFQEIAKYRALRRIWARLMRERYGARSDRACMLRTHTQTGGSALTTQQPENNIIRAAFQALAAVLGGVQSMALSCYDEGLAIPTQFAQQIALRTQQIIAHEAGATEVADPLAGSYYVERLTDELESRVREEMDRIEGLGGAVAAVESGYYQREILEVAYRYQQEVDSGKRIVVGVNRFQKSVSDGIGRKGAEIFHVDEKEVRREQESCIQAVKAARNPVEVNAALEALRQGAQAPAENLVPRILAAVKAYATLGEICDVLRGVWGVHRDTLSDL
ncbi:MAG: methylmalonyl-CoA mutase family protein [bacterium]